MVYGEIRDDSNYPGKEESILHDIRRFPDEDHRGEGAGGSYHERKARRAPARLARENNEHTLDGVMR